MPDFAIHRTGGIVGETDSTLSRIRAATALDMSGVDRLEKLRVDAEGPQGFHRRRRSHAGSLAPAQAGSQDKPIKPSFRPDQGLRIIVGGLF
jgi:hypothetical protein